MQVWKLKMKNEECKMKKRRNEKYSLRVKTIGMLVKTIILKEINLNVFEFNKIYSSLYQCIHLRLLVGLKCINKIRQRNYDSMFIMSQWSYGCYLLSIAMNCEGAFIESGATTSPHG